MTIDALAALLRGACTAFRRLSAEPAGTYAAMCEATCVVVLVLKAITAQVGIILSWYEELQAEVHHTLYCIGRCTSMFWLWCNRPLIFIHANA